MAFFGKIKNNRKNDSDLPKENGANAGPKEQLALALNQKNGSLCGCGEAEGKVGILERFKKGLSKTRQNISGKIENLVKNTRKLDDNFFNELEEILIQADVGISTSEILVNNIKNTARKNKIKDPSEVTALIRKEITDILQTGEVSCIFPRQKAHRYISSRCKWSGQKIPL